MTNSMNRIPPFAGNLAAGLAPQQSIHPYDAGYAALPVQNQRPIVRATAPASARAATGDPVVDAYNAMLNASDQFAAYLSRIDGSQYTDGGAAQIDMFQSSPAYLAVGTAVQAVLDSAGAADDASTDALSALSDDDDATDAAAEARSLRVWARQRAQLDGAAGGGQLYDAAVQAIMGASPNERRVLATELPSYLKARGQKSTDWVNAALRQADPMYAAAASKSDTLSYGATVTLANSAALDRAIGNTYSPFGYRAPFFIDPATVL